MVPYERARLLKGLAIAAVVVIHFITSFYDVTSGVSRFGWVSINQLLRFSVPLFVAASGYGLARKYWEREIEFVSFINRRGKKLLPLYLLWVLVTLLVVLPVERWSGFALNYSWWQWLLGRADYHLYFVPMIFQLYLLFPLLLGWMKKRPFVVTALSFAGQVGVYWVYSRVLPIDILGPIVESDQSQYVYFFSWLFYFVWGIFLAGEEAWVKKRWKQLRWWLFGLVIVGFGLSLWQAMAWIYDARNVVLATRFTRVPVLLMATGMVSLLMARWLPVKGWLEDALSWVGKYSYVIYLSHPLVLRMVLDGWWGTVAWWAIGWGVVLVVIGWWVSLALARWR